VYGVEDDELHQAIGSNWIKGLVKRVMVPGCQFDEVLALESKQGMRKSTSIRELGKPWHAETTHSIDDKDFYLLLAQNVIVEFSEGDIFDKASTKKIKSEVTKIQDQVRPPYERGIVTFKRSCVFCVTTNKLELKDETGNRRWLPVELQKVADIDWIKENREQMFAEAFYRVMVLGETTHEYPDNLEELQSSRMEYNDLDETILNWYVNVLNDEDREQGISLSDAYIIAYPEQQKGDKRKEWELSAILKRTLHLDNKNTKIDGRVRRRWRMSDKTKKLINKEKNINSSLTTEQLINKF
jgi:predicted P-loop ATPase